MKSKTPKKLITGANGQIGTELTAALRSQYGDDSVIASDIKLPASAKGAFRELDVVNKTALQALVQEEGITEIYHLAASLSAVAEKQPVRAWELNMQGLLNVLDAAKIDRLKVFWPSSIAVFNRQVQMQPSTVYGISKVAGELWCQYYYQQYGVDVRSLRYPGLISYTAPPGGGTTDYAVDIFHQALKHRQYKSFIKAHTALPMMYMPDAVQATLQLMEAPAEKLTVRTSYNIHALTFTPEQLAAEIEKQLPSFKMFYQPDSRQQIADNWPASVNDKSARDDWGWAPQYDLSTMVRDMLHNLKQQNS